ncbi:MORN repeat-containing protein 5 isoform X2 [Odontomachus brunneus]|uniref:MORN repeat-containing protein 5 isoform X2 n=1 Tax=Odontomachus brunneus TaxID=486640 RepID=UPI0013F25C6A|nr:MORN repeat-containing protein 5 isoform X2 [Odontomachus brunneus]
MCAPLFPGSRVVRVSHRRETTMNRPRSPGIPGNEVILCNDYVLTLKIEERLNHLENILLRRQSSDMSLNEMTQDDNGKKNEIEMLQEIRFISGGKYEGTWNAIDKESIGRYVTSNKVILEGKFQDGMLHGRGSIYWPRGQVMDGTWNRGKMEKKRYTFADGLTYQEDNWTYCTFPDRRFYKCIVNGLRPARKVLRTNEQPTKIIPPFCYDTGIGIFDPGKECVLSYRNCKKVLHIPTMAESVWIKEHCRKGWSAPIGHKAWLYEYFQSGAADFASLPQVPPEDNTKNWWRRLTRFTRHSPANAINTIRLCY